MRFQVVLFYRISLEITTGKSGFLAQFQENSSYSAPLRFSTILSVMDLGISGPLSSQLRSTRDRFPDQAFVPQTAGGHVKYDLTDEKSCDTLQILSRGEQELYD